jgi:hypothetical protein
MNEKLEGLIHIEVGHNFEKHFWRFFVVISVSNCQWIDLGSILEKGLSFTIKHSTVEPGDHFEVTT